jgi:hypothetical protein
MTGIGVQRPRIELTYGIAASSPGFELQALDSTTGQTALGCVDLPVGTAAGRSGGQSTCGWGRRTLRRAPASAPLFVLGWTAVW